MPKEYYFQGVDRQVLKIRKIALSINKEEITVKSLVDALFLCPYLLNMLKKVVKFDLKELREFNPSPRNLPLPDPYVRWPDALMDRDSASIERLFHHNNRTDEKTESDRFDALLRKELSLDIADDPKPGTDEYYEITGDSIEDFSTEVDGNPDDISMQIDEYEKPITEKQFEANKEILQDLERFIGKLYEVSPLVYWKKRYISDNPKQLRKMINAAVKEACSLFPYHQEAIEQLGASILIQQLNVLDTDRPKRYPLAVFSSRGQGISSILNVFAKNLKCRYKSHLNELSPSDLHDYSPAIIEIPAEELVDPVTESFTSLVNSYFVYKNNTGTIDKIDARESLFSNILYDGNDDERLSAYHEYVSHYVIVFNFNLFNSLDATAKYTPEELVSSFYEEMVGGEAESQSMSQNSKQWLKNKLSLFNSRNTVIFNRYKSRQLIEQIDTEIKDTLSNIQLEDKLHVNVSNTEQLAALLFLSEGYPSLKTAGGLGKDFIYKTLYNTIASKPNQSEFMIEIAPVTDDEYSFLTACLPHQEWYSRIEAVAVNLSFSNAKISFEMAYDKKTRVFNIHSVKRRNPKVHIQGKQRMITTDLKFKDIIGHQDVKERFRIVLDYFKNPEPFRKYGVMPPLRILLEGPIGCGKTTLAKALAGEANIPFFYISAGEITSQKYAGWGGCLLRELFVNLESCRPSILFIDELDAFGKRGDISDSVMFDQRSVLNTLLTNLDGLDKDPDILIIGATNRPQDIDEALLRPGRFGTRFKVGLLSKQERTELFKLLLAEEYCVNETEYRAIINLLVNHTIGNSNTAKIVDIVQELKIMAVKDKREKIGESFVKNNIEHIILGKKIKSLSSKSRIDTAYHEAGHTIVLKMLMPGRIIQSVDIGLREASLGRTIHADREDDKELDTFTRNELIAYIMTVLAGSLAEKLINSYWNLGSGGDLKKAISLATLLISEIDVGLGLKGIMMANKQLLGRDQSHKQLTDENECQYFEYSDPEFAEAVLRILNVCSEAAMEILMKGKPALDNLANLLAKREVLYKEDVERLVPVLEDREKIIEQVMEKIISANRNAFKKQ